MKNFLGVTFLAGILSAHPVLAKDNIEIICPLDPESTVVGCVAQNKQLAVLITDGSCQAGVALDSKTGDTVQAKILRGGFNIYTRKNGGKELSIHSSGTLNAATSHATNSCRSLVNNTLIGLIQSRK